MVRKIYDLSIFEDVREMFVNDITLSWREVEWGEPEKMENINYRQSKRGNIERESLMISGWLSAGWTVQLWLSRLGTGLTVTHQELANKWISTRRTAGRHQQQGLAVSQTGVISSRLGPSWVKGKEEFGGWWWMITSRTPEQLRPYLWWRQEDNWIRFRFIEQEDW